MKTEDEIRLSLRTWLSERGSEDLQLQDDLPLIENRIITSLQVMDLILYIERLSGRRVEIEDLKPGSFRDINSIYSSFFGER